MTLSEQSGFVGDVVVRWLVRDGEEDREMELTEEFGYNDPRGVQWRVPAKAVIDGASIPRIFWTLFGPPFVGNYRRATVIHDYYSNTQERPWQQTHRVFYDAAVDGGVGKLKAKLMYIAIRARGPRWPDPRFLKLSYAKVEELVNWAIENDPSLDAIDEQFDRLESNAV